LTVLFAWSGDSTHRFDHEMTACNASINYASVAGRTWLRVTGSGATKIFGKSPLGEPSTTYFRFRYRKTGNPSSGGVFLHPFTSGGATAFRLRVGSTGTIILDGASTNGLDTSSALANDTTYILVGQVSTSAASVTIYANDGTTVIDTIAATNTFGLVDNWRMGQIGNSPTIPDYYVTDLVVATTSGEANSTIPAPTAIDGGFPRVAIIGDSLTAMSGANGAYIYTELVNHGFPPQNVYLWGVGGKKIADADLTTRTTAQNITDAVVQLGGIDVAILALGTNDRPSNNATVDAALSTAIGALTSAAPDVDLHWIGLTSKQSASTDDTRVNGRIQNALTGGVGTFWDWDAYIRAIDGGANPSPLWLTTDNTHMTSTGYPYRAEYYVDIFATSAPEEHEGEAALDVTVALTADGSPTVGDTATLTATATLTGAGAPTLAGSATLTAAGTLSAVGSPTFTDSVQLTVTAALSASGSAGYGDSVNLGATTTLEAAGTPTIADAALLGVTGTLTAEGVPHVSGAANLSAAVELVAVGSGGGGAHATLAVTVTLTATGEPHVQAAAAFPVQAALTASGTPAMSAEATLTVVALLTAGFTDDSRDITLTIAGLARRWTTAPVARRFTITPLEDT
jgi:hypothetical protein